MYLNLQGQLLNLETLAGLPKLKNIKALSLASARISSVPLDTLGSTLGNMSSLTSLDLSGLYLEQGANLILRELSKLGHLTRLNFASNRLEAADALLFLHEQRTSLQYVNFDYCVPDQNVLCTILRNMCEMPRMTCFNVSCYFRLVDDRSDMYVYSLGVALSRLPRLRELYVSAPSRVFLKTLTESLRLHSTLRSLTLRVPVDTENRYDHVVQYTTRYLKKALCNVSVTVW